LVEQLHSLLNLLAHQHVTKLQVAALQGQEGVLANAWHLYSSMQRVLKVTKITWGLKVWLQSCARQLIALHANAKRLGIEQEPSWGMAGDTVIQSCRDKLHVAVLQGL